MTTRELNLSRGIKVSLEDYDLLNTPWHVTKLGYAIHTIEFSRRKRVTRYLHQQIARRMFGSLREISHIDHIDGNKLNNERSNLRKANASLSSFNRKLKKYSGISKTIGGKYYGVIMINYKKIQCYPKHTIEEALQDRLNLEMKHFGEYAPRETEEVGASN